VLQRFDFQHQLLVVGIEAPAPFELVADFAADQRLADEQLARRRRVQRPEVHPPARIDDDTVQGNPLESDRLHRLLLPVRVEPAPLEQVRAHPLQPFRFDARDAARKQACRFADFSGDEPLAGLFLQCRSRMDQKLDAARTQVMRRLFRFAADVAEQAGEQCAMNRVVSRRQLVLVPLLLGDQRVQLAVDVPPLAHAQRGEEVLMTRLDEFALRLAVLDSA
jgi:hypothetical protein